MMNTLNLFMRSLRSQLCLIHLFILYNIVDAEKNLLGEYTTNEERISNLIKVTYKLILGAGKELSYTYSIRYSAKYPYFWKHLHFV